MSRSAAKPVIILKRANTLNNADVELLLHDLSSLLYIAQGDYNFMISEKQHCEICTVDKHHTILKTKTGCSEDRQLIAFAFHHRIIICLNGEVLPNWTQHPDGSCSINPVWTKLEDGSYVIPKGEDGMTEV